MSTKTVDLKEEPKEEKKSARQLEIERLRKIRVAPGIPSKSLDYPTREGYVRRVVVDRPGRVEKFLRGAWDFVQKDDLPEQNPAVLKATTREGMDSRVSQVVGSHKDGSPMMGYLMELPQELYDEDQAAKMEAVDALEDTLSQGSDADGAGRVGKDGRYVPKQVGIKIGSRRRR